MRQGKEKLSAAQIPDSKVVWVLTSEQRVVSQAIGSKDGLLPSVVTGEGLKYSWTTNYSRPALTNLKSDWKWPNWSESNLIACHLKKKKKSTFYLETHNITFRVCNIHSKVTRCKVTEKHNPGARENCVNRIRPKKNRDKRNGRQRCQSIVNRSI